MRTAKYTLMICLMVGLAAALNGQDRKDIRDAGIISLTVNEYFLEEGLDEPQVESIEKFNEDGEVIELQEFNKRGEVTCWEKYSYDEDRNLIEEVFLNGRGKVIRTEKSIYKEGFKVEKQYFNERDKLYKKKAYVYEHSK
jgi:hypothetical protein